MASLSVLSPPTVQQSLGPRRKLSPFHSQEQDGWSLIHVFTGNSSHIVDHSHIQKEYYATTRWFSQVQQDLIISTLLRGKTNGYFVDLAANDAIRISNTYALERDFGWQGLCIEPNPMYWPSLAYRKCHVVAAVIGKNRMEQVQFKYPNRAGPQGGIVGPQFDNQKPSHFGEDHPRFTMTLREVFERFDTPNVIDYLSLDIEGSEDYVMEDFPFDRYRFNLLTVERPGPRLYNLLKQHGYRMLKKLKKKMDTLWVHESVEASLDKSALDIDTQNYKYHEQVPTAEKT